MRIFALSTLTSFAGFATLGAAFAADAPPTCEHRYLTMPWRAPCAIAIDGAWYLTPGFWPKAAGLTIADAPRFRAGTATVAGMTGATAIYMSGGAPEPTVSGRARDALRSPESTFIRHGGLERRISLRDWQGKRLRLTLRLKQEGDARAYASVQIVRRNETAIRTASHRNKPDDGAWQTHSFVLDVPDDAIELATNAGLTGKGTIWLDGFTLAAVSRDIPVSWTIRVGGFYDRLTPFYDFPNPNDVVGTIIPVPGPLRKEGS